MRRQRGNGFLGAVIVLVVAVFIGNGIWASAHRTIATECERLGAFYVGDKVYQCQEKVK